jgi:hypothetical protein
MALETPLEHESGVIVRYHRILEARFNFLHRVLEVHVEGFVGEEIARAGKRPLQTETVFIPFDELTHDARGFLYPMLSQLPTSPFVDAVPAGEPVGSIGKSGIPELTTKAKLRPALPPMPPAPVPPP